jgi:hypothetical protein
MTRALEARLFAEPPLVFPVAPPLKGLHVVNTNTTARMELTENRLVTEDFLARTTDDLLYPIFPS